MNISLLVRVCRQIKINPTLQQPLCFDSVTIAWSEVEGGAPFPSPLSFPSFSSFSASLTSLRTTLHNSMLPLSYSSFHQHRGLRAVMETHKVRWGHQKRRGSGQGRASQEEGHKGLIGGESALICNNDRKTLGNRTPTMRFPTEFLAAEDLPQKNLLSTLNNTKRAGVSALICNNGTQIKSKSAQNLS